jgi:hypothetical protein
MNHDSTLGTEAAYQVSEVAWLQGDAARSRREAWPRDMDENSAAAAGDPRAGVVIDLDNDVVKTVVAPQPVAWFIGRPAECPIIAAVAGVFAPSIARADATGR